MKTKVYPVPQVDKELSNLGKCLKISRLRRKLSQTELAARCNVTRETIARLESDPGSVSLEIFFTVLYMLDRLGEIDGFMNPEKDRYAMDNEVDRLLNPKRGKKEQNPDDSVFDMSFFDNNIITCPLTGEKFDFKK